MVARMGELIDEVSVIGQKDQSFTVRIEPSNRLQSRISRKIYELCDKAFRVTIGQGAGDAFRLVHRDIIETSRGFWDRTAVDSDSLRVRISFNPKFDNYCAIDGNTALTDPLLRCPPRREPGGGENFLQSFWHV